MIFVFRRWRLASDGRCNQSALKAAKRFINLTKNCLVWSLIRLELTGELLDGFRVVVASEGFSIDDAATTEIDAAFSLQALPGLGWRVGIHIAAPGLGIAPGSPLDDVAPTAPPELDAL